ncbi:MAG: hypothetical protein R3B48_28390 [Kofleriaceae bacterium]
MNDLSKNPDAPVTNRDLYCFIAELVRRGRASALPLQAYLESLHQLGRARAAQPSLPVGAFAELLSAAFAPTRDAPQPCAPPSDGYLIWEKCITTQIQDLQEMRAAGTLEYEHRFFGVDAPRGARWYNFEPSSYLECGAAGTFGGWEEGDATGRVYVPGPVAVLDESGAVVSMDPRDVEEPIVELPPITWEQFTEFLEAGQCYE